MTESKTLIIQSDVYFQVKPVKISLLKEKTKSGSRHDKFNSRVSAAPYSTRDTDLYTTHIVGKPTTTYALLSFNFTNQQILELLSKSISLVENTEAYTLHVLNELFEDGQAKSQVKQYFNPPGTIRVYDRDLICYYTGRDWKKLEQ